MKPWPGDFSLKIKNMQVSGNAAEKHENAGASEVDLRWQGN